MALRKPEELENGLSLVRFIQKQNPVYTMRRRSVSTLHRALSPFTHEQLGSLLGGAFTLLSSTEAE